MQEIDSLWLLLTVSNKFCPNHSHWGGNAFKNMIIFCCLVSRSVRAAFRIITITPRQIGSEREEEEKNERDIGDTGRWGERGREAKICFEIS